MLCLFVFSLSLLLSVPREGCASCLRHFLGILTYVLAMFICPELHFLSCDSDGYTGTFVDSKHYLQSQI